MLPPSVPLAGLGPKAWPTRLEQLVLQVELGNGDPGTNLAGRRLGHQERMASSRAGSSRAAQGTPSRR